jgi:general secretion pathway protein C
MALNDNRAMASRLLTFAVWALVAASGLFWGLRVFVKAPGLPASAMAPTTRVALGGDLARLLGATEQPAAAEEEAEPGDDRYQLLGVVAPKGAAASADGVALIAVGGQPAKAFRTGMTVEEGTVLLSVGKRSAQLGPKGGPVAHELSLPELAAAATGVPGRVNAPASGGPVRPLIRPMGGTHAAPQAVPPEPAEDADDNDQQ